jgi:ribose 5-phosphate isomerase RpiB
MKKPTHSSPLRAILAVLSASLLLLAGTPLLQAQKIDSRPLTPQEIADYGLPYETMTSGGLLTVGVGEAVYLEAQVPKGTVATGVVWNILDRPLGGSVADFEPTPIPADMPIYSPGDREVLEVAGRTMFVPDLAGKYQVQAVVSTTEGTLTLQAQVTGAFYTGVGIMNNAVPKYPQCALCHEEQSINYMSTTHATYFERAIDGHVLAYYNESCTGCHTLGKGPQDIAGGFFSVANDLGWTFPDTLQPGNWAGMPEELKAMANVQCEHCHGAGSQHHGDATTISVSLSAGDCAQCHDKEPYYKTTEEWSLSRHAVATRYPTGENRAACVACHSGIGFIESTKGISQNINTDYEAITCAVCHDPHSAENPAQLRTVESVVLRNGVEVTAGGTGKLCMNCHKGRQHGEEFAVKYSPRFSPHSSVQADMLAGTNAVEYGRKIPSTAHLNAVPDGCATCHMHDAGSGDPARHMVGGHTFKMVYDSGTPDDHSDDVDLVGACQACHGPMESFNIARSDLNYDGVVEGIKEEIQHLMDAVAMNLPPMGEPTIAVAPDFTVSQLRAAFNHVFVRSDGSGGIHNPRYAAGLLQASLNDLLDPFNDIFSGINIPSGGEWFYSKWFEFYAPTIWEGWIYHYEHGHLYVRTGDDDKIYLYDLRTRSWHYTTPEIYPIMYAEDPGEWVYYGGRNKNSRMFFSFSTGKWTLVN